MRSIHTWTTRGHSAVRGRDIQTLTATWKNRRGWGGWRGHHCERALPRPRRVPAAPGPGPGPAVVRDALQRPSDHWAELRAQVRAPKSPSSVGHWGNADERTVTWHCPMRRPRLRSRPRARGRGGAGPAYSAGQTPETAWCAHTCHVTRPFHSWTFSPETGNVCPGRPRRDRLAALRVVARRWQQPRCAPTGEGDGTWASH